MIAFLRGTLLEVATSGCIVDVNGVGYAVQIPLSTYEKLPREGEPVSLYVFTQVREDAITLFGFISKEEKALFEELLGVSGIGGKLALNVLGGLPPSRLVAAVEAGDVKLLSKINGVGKRTAERLVVDLRGKLDKIGVTAEPGTLPAADPRSGAIADAILALSQLGLKSATLENTVRELAGTMKPEACTCEALITLALQKINAPR